MSRCVQKVEERARALRALHAAPEILRVVNVWDVVSAKTILALPETKALATAGHSIAATFGYPDGTIPLDITLDMVGRIVEAAGDIPVSADLDNGYEKPGETVRRAIGVGIVGANVEDRLLPLKESVARVEAMVAAAQSEGIGVRRLSVIGLPGALPAAKYEELGVARISYGPTTQRVALTALQDVAKELYADGVIPDSTRALN